MAPWGKGRAEVEGVLGLRELEPITPDRNLADRLVAQAGLNLMPVGQLALPRGSPLAYRALYDAARMALTAMLADPGPPSDANGGHLAVYHAVKHSSPCRWAGPVGPFDAMRRRRNEGGYGSGPDDPKGTAQRTWRTMRRAPGPSSPWSRSSRTRCLLFEVAGRSPWDLFMPAYPRRCPPLPTPKPGFALHRAPMYLRDVTCQWDVRLTACAPAHHHFKWS